MVFNQQLFDTEKRKFGEALALDRDAKRAKLHAESQATQAPEDIKSAPPADMEKYFKPGQAIYRGAARNAPASINTSEGLIAHLFPGGQMTTGKSWSTHPAVAKRFARQDRTLPGADEQAISMVLHSAIDPATVSFDSGMIENDAGEMTNWSRGTDWRERHSGGSVGHGALGEEEIIMKAKSQVPITGITYRMGSMMNHHQFETPLTATTTYPARNW